METVLEFVSHLLGPREECSVALASRNCYEQMNAFRHSICPRANDLLALKRALDNCPLAKEIVVRDANVMGAKACRVVPPEYRVRGKVSYTGAYCLEKKQDMCVVVLPGRVIRNCLTAGYLDLRLIRGGSLRLYGLLKNSSATKFRVEFQERFVDICKVLNALHQKASEMEIVAENVYGGNSARFVSLGLRRFRCSGVFTDVAASILLRSAPDLEDLSLPDCDLFLENATSIAKLACRSLKVNGGTTAHIGVLDIHGESPLDSIEHVSGLSRLILRFHGAYCTPNLHDAKIQVPTIEVHAPNRCVVFPLVNAKNVCIHARVVILSVFDDVRCCMRGLEIHAKYIRLVCEADNASLPALTRLQSEDANEDIARTLHRIWQLGPNLKEVRVSNTSRLVEMRRVFPDAAIDGAGIRAGILVSR